MNVPRGLPRLLLAVLAAFLPACAAAQFEVSFSPSKTTSLAGEPVFQGIFLNSHVSPRDHVAVYLVRGFRQDRPPEPNREIIDSGFFETKALPEGTTAGTRLRIAEVFEDRPQIPTWR